MITELNTSNPRGIPLVCRFGYRYLACKPVDISEDSFLGLPLMEFWSSCIFGEQFITNLHEWGNPDDIIEKLFSYSVNDEYLQATYTRQKMIDVIALQLQEKKLHIYFTEDKKPLFSNKHYTIKKSTASLILKEVTKLSQMTDEEKPSSEDSNAKVENKSRIPRVDPLSADIQIKSALLTLISLLETKKVQLAEWDSNTQRAFKQWFGTTDVESVKMISDRVDKALKFAKNLTLDNFAAAETDIPGEVAYIYREDESTIYLGDEFRYLAKDGYESKAGTIVHEISHFNSVGGTEDYEYQQVPCLALAKKSPDLALNNADSFMYFIEGK